MNGAQIPTQGAIPTFDPSRQRPVMPSQMELVENACDRTVSFEIGGFPGSPAMLFTLEPGAQAYLPSSYCRPIEGANPHTPRPSILAMVASLEPYPGGPQVQIVVPVREVDRARARWHDAVANAPQSAVVMLQDTEGRQVPLSIPKPTPRRVAPPVQMPDEDDEIEPPPPGAVDLRAAPAVADPVPQQAAPAAPRTVGEVEVQPVKGRKGT